MEPVEKVKSPVAPFLLEQEALRQELCHLERGKDLSLVEKRSELAALVIFKAPSVF